MFRSILPMLVGFVLALLVGCGPSAPPTPQAATLAPAAPTPLPSATTDTAATAAVAASSTAIIVDAQNAQRTATAQMAAAQAVTETAVSAASKRVFVEDFRDNRNAWFTGTFSGTEQNGLVDGVFQVAHEAPGVTFELYQVRPFVNFAADLGCKVAQGGQAGSCGLLFGAQKEAGRWEFELFDNYYRLTLYAAGSATTLLEGDPAGAIHPSDWNTLRVVRRDGQIRLYLNGVFLKSLADARQAEGFVGVSTGGYQTPGSGPVIVQLDNFTLWEFP